MVVERTTQRNLFGGAGYRAVHSLIMVAAHKTIHVLRPIELYIKRKISSFTVYFKQTRIKTSLTN